MSEQPARITRRKLLTGTGKVAAAAAAVSTVGWIEVGNPVSAGAASPSGEVGTASGGRNAFEYVGQVDQDGDNLVSYGYLSAIAGLDVSQLFTGDPHDETTARFTYFGKATLYARVEGNGLFVIDAAGSVNYYFNLYGGASFGDPSSFKAGKQISIDTADFHDVLSVTSPDTGLPRLTAALQRTKAAKFTLAGTTYTFGHVGLLERSTASGLSMRTDPKPKSKMYIGGDAVVTGDA